MTFFGCVAVFLSQSSGWNLSTRLFFGVFFFATWLIYSVYLARIEGEVRKVLDKVLLGLLGLGGGLILGYVLIFCGIPVAGRGGVLLDDSFFTDGLAISFGALLLVYIVLKVAIWCKFFPA